MVSANNDVLKYFEERSDIIQKIKVKEITQSYQYTKDQSSESEFDLLGPSLIFVGNQAAGEPNDKKQALMTSLAFMETFNGDFNIEILITIWGPMWDSGENAKEIFNFEFSVISTNPMKIIYDDQGLGIISNTYCVFEAKISDINDIQKI